MSESRQRAIIKVFRKYSNAIGPDALDLVEAILEEHNIGDREVELSVEALAKEYNKQDDATMKVSVEVLRRVYELLQNQGNDSSAAVKGLDPESHLYFIDAFEMPCWYWSEERNTFERFQLALTVSGTPESRVRVTRDRLNIIKQCLLRNEHFSPSTIPSRDREHLVTLKSTKQLLGRAGERFLLLGVIAPNKEGKLCIEDADGAVELDFSKLDGPGEGLFTEGCIALVEGEYTEEGTLEIVAVGLPPCESRHTSRSIYGHIDFLGHGLTSLIEDGQLMQRVQEDLSGTNFFCMSDVWLDDPRTLPGLRKVFENCIDNDFMPKVMILCGNFTRYSLANGTSMDIQRYQESFDALADLIASFPQIARYTHFLLVPGPLDLTANSTLPRKPLLPSLLGRLKSKVPKIHFGSNPCRIKFFHQEIVVFRDDLMSKLLRNVVGVKPDTKSRDLKRFLVQTILDQGHLCPLSLNIQPVMSDYDHALRLYPLPTAILLADKYDRYKMTYTGCHLFNPSSFVGSNYNWATYNPSETNSEECVVDMNVSEE